MSEQKPNETEKLAELMLELEKLQNLHLDYGQRMFAAFDGAVYPTDLFIVGALRRSMCQLSGFRLLMGARNYVCSAALVRMQLDNALRMYACANAPSSEQFVLDVMDGKRIRDLRDLDGKLMRDRYLVEKLSERYPWVQNLYEKTSGFVHLSEKHIFAALRASDDDRRIVEAGICADDRDVPTRSYLELAAAFRQATVLFLNFVEGWIFTKSNPEEAARLKKLHTKNESPELGR